MNNDSRKTMFLLFFLSGFCSMIYQVVWIRLAFAGFGIVTPVLSVIISVFMLGLSLGSWAGGRLIEPLVRRSRISANRWYAFSEIAIGISAFAVPWLFLWGRSLLLGAGEANSVSYLFWSAVFITAAILPWCVFMGATFPFMMAYLRRTGAPATRNFSFLYSANVIGAMSGTLIAALAWIENFGFSGTLRLAGLLNLLVAIVAFTLKTPECPAAGQEAPPESGLTPVIGKPKTVLVYAILFTTGFTSLAMEVVWSRAFTPVLGTQVYAFAFMLAGYLLATWIGSLVYRRDAARGRVRSEGLCIALLAVFAFLPVVLNDPQLQAPFGQAFGFYSYLFLALASIFPFCAMLGYFTPYLIDEYARGNPVAAGRTYAVNILGCIAGPIFASYVLLPLIGVRYSLAVLAVPYVVFLAVYFRTLAPATRWFGGAVSASLLAGSLFYSSSYEEPAISKFVLKRDHTATVICTGEGMEKRLLINGIGITHLTPITKFMSHLPLAFHRGNPESALVICFGMGTTYRSMLSWDVSTTAVELIPSVVEMFGYFFDDAESLLHHPKGRVVIDDGRRFLMRTREGFDIVSIDPPPPVEAAGSSLLYSEEFYALVKERLRPGGIVQQWYPYVPHLGDEGNTLCAVTRSLVNSFPHVRAYCSLEGWGVHFLASMSPIEAPDAGEITGLMPLRARADLLEWSGGALLAEYLNRVLTREVPLEVLLMDDPSVRITDDCPFNEYFLLRRSEAEWGKRRAGRRNTAGDFSAVATGIDPNSGFNY